MDNYKTINISTNDDLFIDDIIYTDAPTNNLLYNVTDDIFTSSLDESASLLSIIDLEEYKEIYDETTNNTYSLYIKYNSKKGNWEVGYIDLNGKNYKKYNNKSLLDALSELKIIFNKY